MEELVKQLEQVDKTNNRIKQITEENRKLKEQIEKRKEMLPKYASIAQAAAKCIEVISEEGQGIDEAMISTLTHLDKMLIDEEIDKTRNETETTTLVLHKLLSMVVGIKRFPTKTLDAMNLYQVEQDIDQLLHCFERDGVIPEVPDNASWKKNWSEHQARIME